MIDPCDQYREDLLLYSYGELSSPRRDEIAAHLSNCPNCSAEAEQLQKWQGQVRTASQVEVPPTFWQEYRRTLKGRLSEKRKHHGWLPRPAPRPALIGVLGLLLVVGMAIWMMPRPHSPQALPTTMEHPGAVETLDLVQNLGMFDNLALLEEMDALEESGVSPEAERVSQQ